MQGGEGTSMKTEEGWGSLISLIKWGAKSKNPFLKQLCKTVQFCALPLDILPAIMSFILVPELFCLFFFSFFGNCFCSKSGAISYKAQSQDEEALVRAAARLHMIFFNKSANILGRTLAFFGC